MTNPESPNEALQLPTATQAPEEPSDPPSHAPDPRWRLAVDVVVFQGKLALDALRDLFLSPISIAAAVFGAIFSPKDPGRYFYDLMRWGRRSDHFINLFSAGQDPSERDGFASVDDIVDTVEKVVRDEHQRGGVSAEARAHFERTLHRLKESVSPKRRRLSWQVKRAAVRFRQEARKVRDQIKGPGDNSGS